MRNIGSIRYEKAQGRQLLYFGDSNADFYVLFKEKLYPLRKQFLESSSYFLRKINKKHKVHVIEASFNSSVFERVLSCFYGMKCIYERGRETDQIMEVIKFLECKDLQDLLVAQIQKNFNQYQIFFVLEFASKFNHYQLEKRCQKELIKENFQQLNFNRLSLINTCKEQTFTKLIKLHQRLKRQGKIAGIQFQCLRKIIAEYNIANSASVDLITVFRPPTALIILEEPQEEQDSPLALSTSTRYKKNYSLNLKQKQIENSVQTKDTQFGDKTVDLTMSYTLYDKEKIKQKDQKPCKFVKEQQIINKKDFQEQCIELSMCPDEEICFNEQKDMKQNNLQISIFNKKNRSQFINISESINFPLSIKTRSKEKLMQNIKKKNKMKDRVFKSQAL